MKICNKYCLLYSISYIVYIYIYIYIVFNIYVIWILKSWILILMFYKDILKYI